MAVNAFDSHCIFYVENTTFYKRNCAHVNVFVQDVDVRQRAVL